MIGGDGVLAAWPDRLVIRLIVPFQTRMVLIGRAFVGGNLTQWILLSPLLRFARTEGATGLMSVNAVAQSMLIPFETARRNLLAMEEAGLVTIDERGVRASPSLIASDRFESLEQHLESELRATLGNLSGLSVPLPVARRRRSDDSRPLRNAAFDIGFAGMEFWRPTYRMNLDMIVLSVIVVGNCSGFAGDRVLANRYGQWNETPPDELRRPIQVAAIANSLGVSYTTAWRSIGRLSKAGLVSRTDDGILGPGSALDRTFDDNRRQTVAYFRRRIIRLADDGVDLMQVATQNLVDRGRIDRDLTGDPAMNVSLSRLSD